MAIGLNRIEALIEKLNRDLDLETTSLTNAHIIDSNYIRFVTQDWNGLTLSTKTDGNADSGFTMANEYIYQVAAIGDAANAFVLPTATAGSLTVFRFTAQDDGGATATWTAASGEFYAAQSLNTDVTNFGDAHPHGRWIVGNDWTDTVATFGGAIVTATAAHNTLSIAMTATNNQTNIGAELAFYCQTTGYWRVAFKGSELGTGALNATFAFSTV